MPNKLFSRRGKPEKGDESQEWQCGGISQRWAELQHEGPCPPVKELHLGGWSRAHIHSRARDDVRLELGSAFTSGIQVYGISKEGGVGGW